MSHSFVNQLIHVIWSTHNQSFTIPKKIQNELYAYTTTLIKSKNGKVFACGGSSDHIHILLLLPPEISLSSLLSHIKSYSSKWIKSRDGIDPTFSWQTGYLAFSVQEDKLKKVCKYIESDEIRHRSSATNYIHELREMLQQQNIPINEQYYLENSHTKIYIHAVWSTYNRFRDLDKEIRDELCLQIEKTIGDSRGKVHAIKGVEDHLHVLLELSKNKALSDLMRDIKINASQWLKGTNYRKYRDFGWQDGYGAFTISLSSVEHVKCYIQQQEEHHRVRSFADEWNDLLLKRGL